MRTSAVLVMCILLACAYAATPSLPSAPASPSSSASSSSEDAQLVYDPQQSRTYKKKFTEYFTYETKSVQYLGGAAYRGYVCTDVFGFMDYWDKYEMICAPEGDDGAYLPFSGVVGIGPDSPIVQGTVFSIYLGFYGGELQLNGYVPDSVLDTKPIKMSPIAQGTQYGYKVAVESITLSANTFSDVLYAMPINQDPNAKHPMVTIVDSGTQRIMLPTVVTSVKNGVKTEISLYDDVMNWMQNNTANVFFMSFSIAGESHSVTLDSNSIGKLSGDFASTLILGQFFFWYNVVVHDLRNSSQPQIGFGPSNLRYTPCTEPNQNVSGVITYPLYYASSDPLRYYTTIDVGSPAQSLDMLVDTGSKDVVLCSKKHFGMPWWVYPSGALVALGILIVVIVLIKTWVSG